MTPCKGAAKLPRAGGFVGWGCAGGGTLGTEGMEGTEGGNSCTTSTTSRVPVAGGNLCGAQITLAAGRGASDHVVVHVVVLGSRRARLLLRVLTCSAIVVTIVGIACALVTGESDDDELCQPDVATAAMSSWELSGRPCEAEACRLADGWHADTDADGTSLPLASSRSMLL